MSSFQSFAKSWLQMRNVRETRFVISDQSEGSSLPTNKVRRVCATGSHFTPIRLFCYVVADREGHLRLRSVVVFK